MRFHRPPLSGLSGRLSRCRAHRRIHLRGLTFRLRRCRVRSRTHRFYLRLLCCRAHWRTRLRRCRAHRRTRRFYLRIRCCQAHRRTRLRRCRAHRRTRRFNLCRAHRRIHMRGLAFRLRRCRAHRCTRRFYLRLRHCRAHRLTRRTQNQVHSRKPLFRVLPNVVAIVHQRVVMWCLRPSALQSLRKRTMQKSQSISGTSER
jgi:hypothetical protein